MKKVKKIVKKIKKNAKKILSQKAVIGGIGGLVLIILIVGGYFIATKFFKPAPRKVYEVAVVVRSQNNPNPEEDRRTSLKAGDVLVVQPEGHNWSRTERISYLILKMNLTAEQKTKLTAPQEREIKFKDLSEEEKKRVKNEGREYQEETRREILRARACRINLGKYFPDFKPVDLLFGQPYLDKVYDWSIVEKKPKVKK
jgi:hypothetical protein